MTGPTKDSGAQPVSIPREQITDEVCPKCGSDEIVGGSVETGGGIAVQETSCGVCDCRWKNVYDFAAVYLIDEDIVIEIGPVGVALMPDAEPEPCVEPNAEQVTQRQGRGR